MDDLYLLWSNEHCAWWRGNRHGYSRGLDGAGRFTREEALQICAKAAVQAAHVGYIAEIPVRLLDIEEFLAGASNVPKEITEDIGFVTGGPS